jgi:hypothetical protein
LANEALRHRPCFQSIIKAKPSNMGVGTNPFYSSKVFDFRVDAQVSHQRCECLALRINVQIKSQDEQTFRLSGDLKWF